jgi:hypothetical protein
MSVPLALVQIVSMLAGTAIITVCLRRIFVTTTSTNTDYLLCLLGAGMIVFPVTGSLQQASAGQDARDKLGALIHATEPHVADIPSSPAPTAAPSAPVPAPTAPTPDKDTIKRAIEAGKKSIAVYDEVHQPIAVRAVKQIFK